MQGSSHSYKQYDVELEKIRTRVLQMGGLVESQIHDAIEALIEGDVQRMDRVDLGDHVVNAHEVEIDGSCTLIIARRQPTAGDLRMLMGVAKIVTDLERCGDSAAQIARRSKALYYEQQQLKLPCIAGIREMGALAVALLRESLNAFSRLDAAAAALIVQEDLEIDRRFQAFTRELLATITEDATLVSASFELLFIAKAIERIGDHAKNIAEQIIYIVRGTDVRHLGYAQLEQNARAEDS